MSKILIIEDEVAIADLERDYLEINDYEVVTAKDGTKGLSLVSQPKLRARAAFCR